MGKLPLRIAYPPHRIATNKQVVLLLGVCFVGGVAALVEGGMCGGGARGCFVRKVRFANFIYYRHVNNNNAETNKKQTTLNYLLFLF